MREAFDSFDTDHSGTIDTNELDKIMRELGMNPTPEHVKEFMKHADADNDGHIDFQEFLAVVRQVCERCFFFFFCNLRIERNE